MCVCVKHKEKKWAGKWKQTSGRMSEKKTHIHHKQIVSIQWNQHLRQMLIMLLIFHVEFFFSFSPSAVWIFFLVFLFFRHRKRYWKWTNRNKNNMIYKTGTVRIDQKKNKLNANDYFRESNTVETELNWTKPLNPTDKLNKSLWCVSVFSRQLEFEGAKISYSVCELMKVKMNVDEKKRDEKWRKRKAVIGRNQS